MLHKIHTLNKCCSFELSIQQRIFVSRFPQKNKQHNCFNLRDIEKHEKYIFNPKRLNRINVLKIT